MSTHATFLNHESWLDATLQYVSWIDAYGDRWALIQHHGGADVRGGYTAPRAFRMLDEYALWSEGSVTMCCTAHNGQLIGEGFDGPVRDVVHAWTSDSSGGTEWYALEGEAVTMDWQTDTDDAGEAFIPCPSCHAPMTVSVNFYH